MGLFGSKNKHPCDDFDLQSMFHQISNLNMELEKLKSQIISLRGLVNRKLGQEAPELTERIKSPDGLDELR